MKDQANKLFVEAIGKLSEANEELCRPEKDMVPFVVCKNSQQAIDKYMRGFLIEKGVDAGNYSTIDDLYTECLKLSPNFNKIDLADFGCTANKIDASYCNNVSKVSKCFDTAKKLDTLLREEKII